MKENRITSKENRDHHQKITFRKQVVNHQKKIMEIAESSPDFIAIIDTNGQILYQNPAAHHMLGIGEEECISIDDLYPEWSYGLIFDEGIPTAIEKGVWKGDTSIKRKQKGNYYIAEGFLENQE